MKLNFSQRFFCSLTLYLALAISLFAAGFLAAEVTELAYRTSPAENIGPEEGVMRRDPSDVIRVGDRYYVWYSKGAQYSGYNATIWYATSEDGYNWTERGEALARGPVGSWEEQSVFTPNILVAEGQYWLFYTAVAKPFINEGPDITKTAIGIAVSKSPEGPWKRLESNPILQASDDPAQFDSLRVDDASLIVRDSRYWLYYKGRQWANSPRNTKMGVAIAETPEGPYLKYAGNPVVHGGHEVLVWPEGDGTLALIGTVGPKGIAKSLQYAPDGLSFSKKHGLKRVPTAPGAYRAHAFTEAEEDSELSWGLHIGKEPGFLPFLERFEYSWQRDEGGELVVEADRTQD